MLCLNNKYLREVITVELLCFYVSVINVVSVEKVSTRERTIMAERLKDPGVVKENNC